MASGCNSFKAVGISVLNHKVLVAPSRSKTGSGLVRQRADELILPALTVGLDDFTVGIYDRRAQRPTRLTNNASE
jgi:hypothetical protein